MSSGESFKYIRHNLDGSAIATYVLIILIVPLKIACRISNGVNNLGWDDALAVVSLIMANSVFYNNMFGVRPMLGHHIGEFDVPQIIRFLKFVVSGELLYVTALGTIKGSLITFYWRLFSIRARIPLLTAAGIIVAWTIATDLALVFLYHPVEAQWDITIPNATTLGRRKVYVGASAANVGTDVILLILPIPYVWQLHAPIVQRILLAGIFLLGCFVSIVSIIRLSIMANLDLASEDVTYTLSSVFIWSLVEVNVGLVCACLPSLRPAIRFLGLGRVFGSTRRSKATRGSLGHLEPATHIDSQGRLHSSKNRGRISNLTGPSQWDEEEDSLQMIRQHDEIHGKTDTNIEFARISIDTDECGESRHTAMPAIKVQRNWQVAVDQR